MVTFGFATIDDFWKKNPEGKKQDSCRFSMKLKTAIFALILSKFKRWYFAKNVFLVYSEYPNLKSILPNSLADSLGNARAIEKVAMF